MIELSSCRKCGQAYSLVRLAGNQLTTLPRSLADIENKDNIYTLTSGGLDSITEDEEEETEFPEPNPEGQNSLSFSQFILYEENHGMGWLGQPILNLPEVTPKGKSKAKSKSPSKSSQNLPPVNGKQYPLFLHLDKDNKVGYLPKCPACGAGRSDTPSLRRFASSTDAPLEVIIDSLFGLLP